MSVESVSRDDERHPDHESAPAPDEPAVPLAATKTPPEDAYWQHIHENERICPRCLRWRVPANRAAIGWVELPDGVKAELAPDERATEEECYPPRIRPPAARRCEDDIPVERKRACPPARAACECGDVDGGQVARTRSTDELLALAPTLGRRLGDLGYAYSLPHLREFINRLKRGSRIQGDDDAVLEAAVGASIIVARGGSAAEIWERLDD